MIRPGIPAPSLAPLLGREVIRERHGVRYFELQARSVLNRSVSRMPFDWTVNPYRGCAMGCRYCYATYSHGYLGIDNAEDFHRIVYVKRDSFDETRRRLARAARKGHFIALGTVTDPYQPGEDDLGATRSFLELLVPYRSVRVGITTKGALILRDLDLLKRIHARSTLSIHVSLISVDADFLRRLEPWAPPPEVRIETMRRLAAADLDVSVSITPILPGLTDSARGFEALISRVAGAGVRSLFRDILFLRSPTKEKYLAWIEREFERLLPAYRSAYGARSRLRGPYRSQVLALVDRIAARHGLRQRKMSPQIPRQLSLF
jgi:DNA repair photolyase